MILAAHDAVVAANRSICLL